MKMYGNILRYAATGIGLISSNGKQYKFQLKGAMHQAKIMLLVLIYFFTAACTSTTAYKKPPSMGKPKSDYQHEQFNSPASTQAGGAALSGLVGGLLGPIGILVTGIGSGLSYKQGIVSYMKQMNNTEMSAIVIEEVTEKRNKELLDNPRWFVNLPPKNELPHQVNVDLGSGNSFIFPVESDLDVATGDVVTVISSSTAHNLASPKADFFKDYPRVVSIRCKANDDSCIKLPENELGIVRRFK